MTHTQTPDAETEARDQQEFDEAVDRKGKVVLEWLAGAGILAALTISIVALVQSGERGTTTAAAQASQPAATTAPAAAATTAPANVIDLKVIGGYKPGPDGKKHDAFTKTEFAVKVGRPLKLKIDNTDDSPHSITSPAAGVSIIVQPGIHTYTLTVKEAGRFQWFCIIPCDSEAHGWAMEHAGFMSGYITAT
jgi:heme/copper-type cytochrome/quinol oxidase subunit 2